MMDLLSSLIFTPMVVREVAATPEQTAAVVVPCDGAALKPGWKDPYYPSKGRSPLRHEYVVPGAWPDETPAESLDADKADKPRLLDEEGEAQQDELDDAEEYDPEYATYLVATTMAEDERRQRRENEEVYRVRYAPDKQYDSEAETRMWMFEEMICKDVMRACRGQDRTLKVTAEMEQKRNGGWQRDGHVDQKFLMMGQGTPGHTGHEQLRHFLRDTVKKRKRGGFEQDGEGQDAGAEREGKRRKRLRTRPHGILKTRLRERRLEAGHRDSNWGI